MGWPLPAPPHQHLCCYVFSTPELQCSVCSGLSGVTRIPSIFTCLYLAQSWLSCCSSSAVGSFNLTGIASTFVCVNDTYSTPGTRHHKFPWWAGLILGLGILTGLLAVGLAALVLILQRQRRRRRQAQAHRVDADKSAGGTPIVNSNGPLPQNDTPLGRESAVSMRAVRGRAVCSPPSHCWLTQQPFAVLAFAVSVALLGGLAGHCQP